MWHYWRGDILYLQVYLQPRASTDQVIGIHDDALKIRLTTPPVEGRANKHLIKFLAQCFKVPEQRVIIIRGETSRKKLVTIDRPKELSILNAHSNGKQQSGKNT